MFWALSALALAIIGMIYGAALWRGGQSFRFPFSRIAWIAAVFLLLCLFLVIQALPLDSVIGMTNFPAGIASRTLSLAPDSTWLMLMRMLGYGLFFFLMLQAAANRARALLMLEAIFFVIATYAAYSLLALTQLGDSLIGMEKWAYAGSATGTFVNRNSFATFLAFGLTIGTSLIFGILVQSDKDRGLFSLDRQSGKALLVFAGITFIAAALLASQSRMGLFAGAVASAAVLALGVARSGRRRGGWVAVLCVGFLGVALVAAFYGSGVLERVGSLESAADVRGALYQQVVDMITARPWLGYGGGSFELAFPLFHHAPVSPDLVWDKAHSSYLTLWSELGLVAGSLPLIMLGGLGGQSLRSAWSDQTNRVLGLAGFGVGLVGMLHSTVDFSLEIQANTYCFLAVLALGVASSRATPQKLFRDEQHRLRHLDGRTVGQ